ncbi:MAG TPA: hypothetical protein VGO93_30850 [Candidatus Xenobia bacterium]|jgi:predicted metalloprotease with PDZ domain
MEAPSTPINYRVDLSGVQQRLLRVSMTADMPGTDPLDVVLPFVTPGSPVNSRNHPGHLSRLQVTDAQGHDLPFDKLETGDWRIQRHVTGPIQVSYDLSSGDFATVVDQLTPEHAYLNGAATFTYVKGHQDAPATVSVEGVPDPHWKGSSTLRPLTGQPLSWYAPDYQELADSNIEVSNFDTARRVVDGTELVVLQHGTSPYQHLHVNAATPAQNLDDFARLWKTFNADYGPFPDSRWRSSPPLPAGVDPNPRYVIQKHYIRTDRGLSSGLEHYHGHDLAFASSAEPAAQRLFDDSTRVAEAATMAHELGHRLLAKYVQHAGIDSSDLSNDHASRGLWLTEGITEWLGPTLELRSGLIGPEQYLRRQADKIARYQDEMATNTTNGEDDSLDASTGNADYYIKGSLVGLGLDLELRHATGGAQGMRDVLLGLKNEFGGTGQGWTLDDVERIACGMADVHSFFSDYLRDRKPLDFNKLLGYAGYEMKTAPVAAGPHGLQQIAQGTHAVTELGITVTRQGEVSTLAGVRPGGPAWTAGLGAYVGLPIKSYSVQEQEASLGFSRPDPFTGDRHDESVSVPLQKEAPAIASVAAPTPDQWRIRQAWLG